MTIPRNKYTRGYRIDERHFFDPGNCALIGSRTSSLTQERSRATMALSNLSARSMIGFSGPAAVGGLLFFVVQKLRA